MKLTLLSLICCWLLFSVASGQELKDVIAAEKNFAAYAVEHSIKDAFLRFLDSNAVMFEKGEIVNAKKLWMGNPFPDGKLLWKPAFAGIAKSGDLAFTTGPWEFKPSMTETSVASGQFATIWIKTAAGEWKFLAHLGMDVSQQMDDYKEIKNARPGKTSKIDTGMAAKLEAQVNQQYQQTEADALINVSADDCWYMVSNNRPLRGISEIRRKAKSITPSGIRFTTVEAKAASSGDLAYAYGYVDYNNKRENYLRVWQHTDKGWKMILVLVR